MGKYQGTIMGPIRETKACSEDAHSWAVAPTVPSTKNALPAFLHPLLSVPEQSTCQHSFRPQGPSHAWSSPRYSFLLQSATSPPPTLSLTLGKVTTPFPSLPHSWYLCHCAQDTECSNCMLTCLVPNRTVGSQLLPKSLGPHSG